MGRHFNMCAGSVVLLLSLVTCTSEPTIHPRDPLTEQDEGLARYRLRGTWQGQFVLDHASYNWTWVFDDDSVTVSMNGAAETSAPWTTSVIRPDVIVIVVDHDSGPVESSLRFNDPDSFFLDAFPDVNFYRVQSTR